MTNAYVCYMANDRDLKGVLIVNYKLKQLNSKYNLVCLVTKLVSEESLSTLKRFNISPININFNAILEEFNIEKEKIDYLFSKFYFGKLFIFLISQFEKLVYLDTDLLIVKNIDHLFERNLDNNTIEMTCDTLMRQAQNGKYNIIKTTDTFNSGVIIFESNQELFKKICKLLKKTSLEKIKIWHSDQTIFNDMYKLKLLNVKLLDYKYNIIAGVLDYHINKLLLKTEDIHVIHFILNPKPWGDVVNRIVFGNIEKQYLLEWINCHSNFVEENLRYSNIQFEKIITE